MVLSTWDFMFLEGWDWKLITKGTQLTPGKSLISSDLKIAGKSYTVGLGMMSYGHDDAKFTELRTIYDGNEITVSPFMLYSLVGTWTGWLPSFFFVSRFSTVTDQYAIGLNPTILLPCKESFEVQLYQPTKNPITGADLTGTVNAYVLIFSYRITDEKRFLESLRKLQKGEI